MEAGGTGGRCPVQVLLGLVLGGFRIHPLPAPGEHTVLRSRMFARVDFPPLHLLCCPPGADGLHTAKASVELPGQGFGNPRNGGSPRYLQGYLQL